MYNPQELQRKAQLNVNGVDTNAQTSLNNNNAPKQEEDNKNWFERGLATLGNVVNNVVMGAVKSLEGIVDTGIMIGGLFGADVEDAVSYDFTGDIFGTDEEGEGLLEWTWGKNLADVSYLDNDNIVNQIAEGVGGLLPTVGVAILTGGTSLAGTAASAGAKAATIGAKIAQTGTFVASAMGNASESALQDGADFNQALGYGALSGVTEGVIESISGGIGGTKMGTVLGKQIAKKTGTKLATTFISEGLEEVASDLIDPFYQRITGVNREAKVDTNNLFRTFVVGGSVGAVMGGAGRKFKAIVNSEIGGEKFLKIADEVSEIEDTITEKERILSSEKKTQIEVDNISVKVADDIGNNLKKISNNLKAMSDKQRLAALQVVNSEKSIINNLFDTNGEIKTGVLEELELSKKRHYSANSILKSQQINEELSNINQEKGWHLEVDDSQINENERVKLAQFYAVKNGLSEKTGKNLNFVMVKGLGAEAIDGFYSPNGKTIYITKDTLNNSLYKTTTHEVEHFVDNDLLQKYLINSAKNDSNDGKLFAEIVKKVVVDKNYGVTKEDIDSAIYKKSIGQKLTQQEELAYSELTAHLAENLLGNEDFIKRLARSNRGLFNKIKNFISDKIKSNSKSERYRMAEYLFDNALKEIKEKDVGETEQFDKTNDIRYTKKGYAKKQFAFQYENFPPNNETHNTAHQDALHWARLDTVEVGDQRLISSNSYWYVVEKFSDFTNKYQVVERISDNEFDKIFKEIKENGRSGRIKSIQEGFVEYDKLNQPSYSLKARKSSSDSFETGHRRENSEVVRMVEAESQRGERTGSNGARDSSQSRSNKQGIKFSLEELRKYEQNNYADSLDQGLSEYENVRRNKSIDSTISNDRQSDRNVPTMAKSEDTGRENTINGRRDSGQSNRNKQGIKFSLKDSKGRTLTKEQQDFFKDSKAVDENGNLRAVYHGTVGEFYTFDKTYLGSATGVSDAKLGFFFTSDKNVALEYAINAHDTKFYNLAHKIADGDNDKFKKLLTVDGYKEFAMTEDIQELGVLKEKGENFEHDVYEVYLNIKNPLIDDWQGLTYRKAKMLKLVTRAIQENYDGVIIKNIDDSYDHDGQISDVYFIFEPNQVKFTTNKKPTEVDDMRFSYKTNSYEFVENNTEENNSLKQSFDTLEKYSETEKTSIEKNTNFTVAETYLDIKDFISELYNFNTDKSLFLGKVNDLNVNLIFKETGLDVKGKSIVLNSSNLKHVFKNHGKTTRATLQGQIPINEENIADIIEAVLNPSSVERSDSNGQIGIIFKKNINGRITAVTILSEKKKALTLKSAWIIKNKQHISPTVDVQAPTITSKTGKSMNAVYNNSILNTEEKVNINSENSLDTNKYSKKSSTLSDGQIKKKLANFTKLKVYSKTETEQIVNSLIDSNLGLDNVLVNISGKTKAEVIDVLWNTLNTADAGKRTGISLKIADYIIENSATEDLFGVEENEYYINTLAMLKPYFHNLDLTEVKSSIKARGENNSVYALWGNKEGISPYTMKEELSEQGFILEGETDAEVFFDMLDKYRNARDYLNKEKTKLLKSVMSEEEIYNLRQNIAKDILRSFDNNGKKSKLADIIDKQKQTAKVWKDLYYEEKARNEAIGGLLKKVGKLKGLKEYKNSTQYNSEQFKGSIEKLERLNWRGNLNESGARKIVGVLNAWYNKDNAIVGAKFDGEVSEDLNRIAGGNGKLTSNEINSLANVVDYFIHFIEHNRQFWENEKWIEQGPLAKEYYEKALENANLKIGAVSRLMDSKYMETFADPMSIARNADRYSDGFFTKTMEDLRNGAVDSEIKAMEIASPIVDFLDRNKKYLKRVNKTTITYRGVEIPIIKAIDLYCELNRDQAILGFVKSGIKLTDVKGKKTITIGGIEFNDELSFDEYKAIAQKEQAEIGKLLNDTDYEFIGILEKIYNEDCKELKKERDMQLRGYTNIEDGYYYPTSRADTRKSINVDFFGGDRVGNESFNKSTVKGAQQTLWIESALDRVLRHIEGVSRYYYLSNPIQNFEVLYNLDLGGNPNAPKSIKTATENTWRNGSEYLRKLMQDIQGIKNGDGSYLFGFLRKGFAKFQLGFNPKVLISQFSSLFASWNILDYGSIVKGFAIKVKTGDVDKYCSLAKLRNNDNAAVKSMGVLDNVDSFTDKFTVLIGKMDRSVIRILFGACQVQVQKNNGLKIGTEENKIKAGELLRKVILETQQNAIPTERSKAMRSSSEFLKGTTMFTADIMKVTARVIDSFGEISTIKARLKIENDPVKREKLMDSLKIAHKKARKSITAMVVQAVYMAILARLFDKFYNRDEEDEEVVTDLVVDFFGNMIGGLPLIKDLYSKVFEGYDFDSFAFSSMNDLFEAVGSVDGLWSGDSREVAKTIRKISYAVGQIFGVPVRNLYNVFYGTSNLISPEFAYKLDDAFYKQSYSSDLKKAIKNNDEDMISTIAGLIMNENVGAFENKATRNEVDRLITAGYDVLPQSIGSSMTIDGETFKLTESQKQEFKKTYNQSIEKVDALVSSNGYKIASDEAKAKAIKYVYKYYFYEAQQDMFDLELDNKLYLFGQIVPIEKMALALAEAPIIAEKSTNKKTAVQRYLQASKLTATQKYMLMGYFGYKNTKGEDLVASAINKTSLTKEQRSILLGMCGY